LFIGIFIGEPEYRFGRRRSLIPPNLRKLRFVEIRDDREFWVVGGVKKWRFAKTLIIFFENMHLRIATSSPTYVQQHRCHPNAVRDLLIIWAKALIMGYPVTVG